MEETMGAGRDGLVSINSSGTDDTDGCRQFSILGMHVLHDAGLNATGM